jgi:hypothetical protein
MLKVRVCVVCVEERAMRLAAAGDQVERSEADWISKPASSFVRGRVRVKRMEPSG